MKQISLLIAAVFLVIVAGCGKQQKQSGNGNREGAIRIVTTTGMIADIARNVGGKWVKVTSLMGPGVDPHLYKASEGDVARMSGADLIFYNGLHLEGKMTDVFAQMKRRVRTEAVTNCIDRSQLLNPPEFKGAHDPHVWFDVRLWMEAVRCVEKVLVEFDSTHAADYRKKSAAYLQQLDSLDNYVLRQAQRVPKKQRVLITAHDAFNYFGRRYQFQVRGLQGISTAMEAGTADLQNLATFIVKRRIPAVFVETSVPPRYIEALRAAVRARGFQVRIGGSLYSDAMGEPGTLEGTYIGMVRHNIDTIVSALLENE